MIDLPRHIVGAAAMVMAFAVIVLVFVIELPPGNREVALIVLGMVMDRAAQVVNFHFGSSEGSKRKTDLLATKPKDAS